MRKLLCLLLFGPVFGETPEAIQKVIDRAAAAPPEIAADALLQIVEAGKVPDRKIRLDLIEHAFELAPGAKFQMPLTSTSPRTDARPSLASEAARQLNTLTLRSRAVLQMLKIDPARGRDLFLQIPAPHLPEHTCNDTLIEDPAPYFDAAQAVFEKGFTPKERKDGNDVAMMKRLVDSISSPRELYPAAQLIAGLRLPAGLVDAFSRAMKRVNGDPLAMQFSVRFDLEQWIFSNFRWSPLPLLDGYRSLLVRAITSPHCGSAATYLDMAKRFGALEQAAGLTPTDIPLLSEAEMTPGKELEPPHPYNFWERPATRKIMADYKALRSGRTDDERSTPEWETQLRAFLNELTDWRKDSGESDIDFFHQNALMYEALRAIVPPGPLRRQLVADHITFLRASPIRTESPAEWYHHVRQVFTRDCDGGPCRDEVVAEVQLTGDAALILYSDLMAVRNAKL